jgi:Xaa-Pro dipeptidase
MFDYAARRARLTERMEEQGVDALFLAPSADLEYLTGVERQIPNFGEASYAHGWVTGAFFRPGADPVFLFPRMFAAFDLREEPKGEVVVVGETDDGPAIFERVARGLGATVAVGDRVWAETVLHLGRVVGFDGLRTGSRLVNELRRVKTDEELAAMGRAIVTVERTMAAVTPLVLPGVTMLELAEAVEHELHAHGSRCPSFTTHIFTGLGDDDFDSGTATARSSIPAQTSVMFDFGGVVDGYCSDFGRTPSCSPRRRRDAPQPPRERRPARSTPPAASRSRTPAWASTSATGWATASAWTSTSGRSSPPRTRRRCSRG